MLLHRLYIEDDAVREVKEFTAPAGIEIYEVVRVMEGVPLFLEDHLKRFYHSAWLLHLEIPLGEGQIFQRLRDLIRVNGIEEGNIRFSWTFRPSGRFLAYFIPHKYPSEEEFRLGVACGLLKAERHDPNAKVVQAGLRAEADRKIREEGWYEVLLISGKGLITEGSRSNVFFIREGVLRTAPDGDILPGITRQKVLQLIHGEGLRLEARSLTPEELESAEAAFLTGTSPGVLPICRVESLALPVNHPCVNRLAGAYNGMIRDYIQNHL